MPGHTGGDAPRCRLDSLPTAEDGNYTDIGAALKLALASFPGGTAKRVVVAAGILLAISIGVDGTSWLRTVPWTRALRLGAAVAAFSLLYTVGVAFSKTCSDPGKSSASGQRA